MWKKHGTTVRRVCTAIFGADVGIAIVLRQKHTIILETQHDSNRFFWERPASSSINMAAVVSPQPHQPPWGCPCLTLIFGILLPCSFGLVGAAASGRSICPLFHIWPGAGVIFIDLMWFNGDLLDMMDMCELNLMITFRRHLGFGPTKGVPYAHFDCLPGFSVNVPWLADIMFARELNLENIHFLCRVFTRQRNCHVIPRWIWISLNIWKLSWRTSCFQSMVLPMGNHGNTVGQHVG